MGDEGFKSSRRRKESKLKTEESDRIKTDWTSTAISVFFQGSTVFR